jgi:hypothetical protein
MNDAVIVTAVRTPVGKRNGGLSGSTLPICPPTSWRRSPSGRGSIRP